MNEFERRVIENAETHMRISSAARYSGTAFAVEYFAYSVILGSETDPFSVGTRRSAIIPIQADSDFVWVYTSAVGRQIINPGGVDRNVDPNGFYAQFTDTGRGTELFSAPTLLSLVAGTFDFVGGFSEKPFIPYILPTPRVVARNTNIKIDVENLGDAVNDDFVSVGINLLGARVYYAGDERNA